MCYHKRSLYAHCNHNAWGPEVKPCGLQSAYNEGTVEEECDIMQAHPRHSIVIQQLCQRCEKNKRATDNAIKKLRSIIRELNETIKRMKKDEKKDVATSLELGSGDEGESESVAVPGDEEEKYEKKEEDEHRRDSDEPLVVISTIEEE